MSSGRRIFLTFAAIFATILLSIANSAGEIREQFVAVDTATLTPKMRFEFGKSRLSITGDTSSIAHEVILRQAALKLFPQAEHQFEFRQRTIMPPGWALLTELTLRALAQTYSSTASISDSNITVRGITMQKAAWDEAVARLDKNLPTGTVFQQQVIVLRPGASLESQCSALFHSALQRNNIEFPPDSNQLGSNTFSTLDELIQIVTDCPAAMISITGHTDASGDESSNQQLSETRANSVMTYMINGGIVAGRLQAVGAGSSTPLLDENSARARQINRRIEFRISFP